MKEIKEVEKALSGLLEKYAVKPASPFRMQKEGTEDELILLPGYCFENSVTEANEIPLLSWRAKRKFVELKKIVADTVIEDICLLRFLSMGCPDKWSLYSLVYRELDIVEYIGNGRIVSVNAVFAGKEAGNIILKLDNGALCSIEVGIQMPQGSKLLDRHEIIARRGVASDRVVDSQVPLSSIYSFTGEGEKRFTDTDMELYGFCENQVDHIRSAFQVFKNPDLIEIWRKQHSHLVHLTRQVFESDEKREKIIL